MSKSMSLFSAFLCTFIWGTTFIAQDTGMDKIGPLTFNGTRFFIGFLSIIPFALFFEKKKIIKEINKDKKLFYKLLFWVGIFLFLGTYVQQAALLYTDVANAAFFTIFYVPMVPIILFMFYSKSLHWSIWPSVLFCLAGVYLLSDFSDATVRLGDSLVILCALFWSLHIIFIGNFIKNFDLPLFFGALQAFVVALLSIIFAIFFETITIKNILNESVSIVYAGALSGGIAFTLQIYAQKNISAAPAAIIFSLEGVFAAIAAWIILDQILGLNNIIGCLLILGGVVLSQLAPIYKKKSQINYS
jgi:drug/metabolite transporter (DMT)-like permease